MLLAYFCAVYIHLKLSCKNKMSEMLLILRAASYLLYVIIIIIVVFQVNLQSYIFIKFCIYTTVNCFYIIYVSVKYSFLLQLQPISELIICSSCMGFYILNSLAIINPNKIVNGLEKMLAIN